MIDKIKKFFSKGDEDMAMRLPEDEKATFILAVDDLDIGKLNCELGEWTFKYTEEFKENQHDYNRIVGFPELSEEYRSPTLWPFFRIRIPGLKQPAIKEILLEEAIDMENELALLKRFGKKTIANPYELRIAI